MGLVEGGGGHLKQGEESKSDEEESPQTGGRSLG